MAGLPYTHSGVLASALAMDKQRTKECLPQRVAGGGLVMRAAMTCCAPRDGPALCGEAQQRGLIVGVYLVHEAAQWPAAAGRDMPDEVMVEAFAPGRELTTTVMGDRRADRDRYSDRRLVRLRRQIQARRSRMWSLPMCRSRFSTLCMDYALRRTSALGCRGVSRTDFRWDEARGWTG